MTNSSFNGTNSSVSDEIFVEGCNLLLASARDDMERVKRCISKQPKHIHFQDYDKRTAIHVASSEGHLDLVKFFVKKGGEVSCRDRWGGTPLDDAHRHHHIDVIKYLTQVGAVHGNMDQSSIIIAAAKGDINELRNFIHYEDVDLNKGDYDKRTALHLASGEGHTEIVLLLIQKGADVNVVDRWGGTPFDDAVKNKQIDCIELLKRHSATAGESLHPSNDTDASLTIGIEELHFIKRIGDGAFGEVYKCRWRETLVAAKCIKCSKIMKELVPDVDGSSDPEYNSEDLEMAMNDFRMEMSIMKDLRHPNICMLLAYSTTVNHEIMVNELMRCSLLDIFKANGIGNKPIPKFQQIIYANHLAQGMNYLHKCNPPIIHRDLKPANLLIDYSGALKIADFGLAKVRPKPKMGEKDYFLMTGETGSYRFMAPEVYRHEQYTETVDVYSFSMIFYYILKGVPPFPSASGLMAVQYAALDRKRPIVPVSWDIRLGDLLRKCWSDDPNDRPSFADIIIDLDHYMQDVHGIDEDDVKRAAIEKACCVIQ